MRLRLPKIMSFYANPTPALLGISACFIAMNGSTYAQDQGVDWEQIDEILGRKPAVVEDVHRYGFPRTDLTVTLDGVTIKPALALGGWVAFKRAHQGAMAMGDLVLLENQSSHVEDDRWRARDHGHP